MKIQLTEIPIKDVVDGYVNSEEEGVVGYGGHLNIRPAYQREFVYKDKQRDAVIETVRQNYPLNTIYWVKNEDGTFELLDGQQRTLSICDYVAGNFSLNFQYFHNLEEDEKKQILDYKLMVYICEGTDKEKLDWFKIINIAGVKLTDQELRNAIYTGPWLTDAKRYFSKTGCVAYEMAKDYMKGSPIRQDYLETAIKWISKDTTEQYMADHQHDPNANGLWLYFQSVVNWTKAVFPQHRTIMKGVNFGNLHDEFENKTIDAEKLEEEITELIQDDDVTKNSGIYPYVLTRNEKFLNIRAFKDSQKQEAYERQKGICIICGKHFELEEMHADHIVPWCKSGKTIPENCQMLCKPCNFTKSGK